MPKPYKGTGRGMQIKKKLHITESVIVTVLNNRNLSSRISMIGRSLREKAKFIIEDNFPNDDREVETYMRLQKIVKGIDATEYKYQLETIAKECRIEKEVYGPALRTNY